MYSVGAGRRQPKPFGKAPEMLLLIDNSNSMNEEQISLVEQLPRLARAVMTGDIEGSVELELTFAGDIEDDGAEGIQRVLGTTVVTGVARSGDDGSYEVELTL